MTVLRIGVLAPDVLDSNGDAANARVLVARARWAGLEAELVGLHHRDDFRERPDVLVAGTGAELERVQTEHEAGRTEYVRDKQEAETKLEALRRVGAPPAHSV